MIEGNARPTRTAVAERMQDVRECWNRENDEMYELFSRSLNFLKAASGKVNQKCTKKAAQFAVQLVDSTVERLDELVEHLYKADLAVDSDNAILLEEVEGFIRDDWMKNSWIPVLFSRVSKEADCKKEAGYLSTRVFDMCDSCKKIIELCDVPQDVSIDIATPMFALIGNEDRRAELTKEMGGAFDRMHAFTSG